MLVLTFLLVSVLSGETDLLCVDGIVDVSPRPYQGKMSKASCRQKARAKGVSFVWGNGNHCHHYNVLLDKTKTASDGLGHWITCGDYEKPKARQPATLTKYATGDDIMCVVGEFDFYYSAMEARCAGGFEVNRRTGKCVPKWQNDMEPENCDSSCGRGFCCDKGSGLCLKCSSIPREPVPKTKKCSEIYGCHGSHCLWYDVGETANEEAVGLSFDSDESNNSVAVTQNTNSGFDMAIRAFAALGFAATFYGAYQHYTK
jgi:hypothetical protein